VINPSMVGMVEGGVFLNGQLVERHMAVRVRQRRRDEQAATRWRGAHWFVTHGRRTSGKPCGRQGEKVILAKRLAAEYRKPRFFAKLERFPRHFPTSTLEHPMAITEADVQTRLRALIDPNTGKDFVSGKAVKKIQIGAGDIVIECLQPTPSIPDTAIVAVGEKRVVWRQVAVRGAVPCAPAFVHSSPVRPYGPPVRPAGSKRRLCAFPVQPALCPSAFSQLHGVWSMTRVLPRSRS
jgi:hypothetical protein